MNTAAQTPEERYANKIRGLLAKAESTTPEEAELLIEKAQELMVRYAISEAMVEQAAGRVTDVIEQREVIIVGAYHERKMDLTTQIATANNCRSVYYSHGTGNREVRQPLELDGKMYKHGIKLVLTGFRSDLEKVLMLDASLQLQCSSALFRWYRDAKQSWWTKSESERERKQFITSFANAVGDRLTSAVRRAEAQAVRDEAERARTTEKVASESVALVLRSRKDQVKDWYDEKYGDSLRTVTRNYGWGSYDAHDAGTAAGQRADVGQPKVGSRKQLSS